MTVSSYSNKFKKIINKIAPGKERKKIFDEETLIHNYTQGLNGKIAKKVVEIDPETLKEAIKIAKKAEAGRNYRGRSKLSGQFILLKFCRS